MNDRGDSTIHQEVKLSLFCGWLVRKRDEVEEGEMRDGYGGERKKKRR